VCDTKAAVTSELLFNLQQPCLDSVVNSPKTSFSAAENLTSHAVIQDRTSSADEWRKVVQIANGGDVRRSVRSPNCPRRGESVKRKGNSIIGSNKINKKRSQIVR